MELKQRIIRFTNIDTNEIFDYELPDDLWYYDSENYDEFILDYDGQSCVINKKVGINADGTIYVLQNPITVSYPFPTGNNAIILTEGDYNIEILGHDTGYLFARLMAKNIYTTQFYTKAETDSIINQTSQSIDLSVNKKLSNYSTTTQMNSAIQLSASSITSNVSETYATKNELNTNISNIEQTANEINLEVSKKASNKDLEEAVSDLNSKITQTASEINLEVSKKVNETDYTSAQIITKINNDTSEATIKADKVSLEGKEINLTSGDINITSDALNIDKTGNVEITGNTSEARFKVIKSDDSNWYTELLPNWLRMTKNSNVGVQLTYIIDTPALILADGTNTTYVRSDAIITPVLTQTSLESAKKDFEKLNNGLDIIKNTDIYKYHLKSQSSSDKKHIGFVIGDSYNYSKDITSQDNDGADLYSMISVCFKAIQEQQEIIEKLENKIKEMESEK